MFELDTPCLILDLLKFRKNLSVMNEFSAARGKKLRPHAKTHKCSRIAKLQLGQGAVGICAAKLDEAAGLINAGIGKVLLTSPVVGATKITRLMELAKRSGELMVVVDNVANAEELERHAADNLPVLDVLIDIDPHMGRTGAAFDDVLMLASSIAQLEHLQLRGVQCYAGNLQHVHDYSQRRELSLKQMRRAQELFRTLKSEIPDCDIFSGTGTGAFDIDSELELLTDMQLGSYCVMDVEYRNIASRDNAECFDIFTPALTLLTTVVSANHDEFVTVDAGLKSLYFTPHAPPAVVVGGQINDSYCYEWFGDEHGRLFYPDEAAKPGIGAKFELILPHCDPTINLFDRIYVTEHGKVVDVWDIDLRGSR